jgi:hypothetical protein
LQPWSVETYARGMDTVRLLREIEALPEEAQQQVADFVTFLRFRGRARRPGRRGSVPALAEDPFIGMWKDREDMQDGGATWVRRLREREWVRARPHPVSAYPHR